jgi:hypothetical protein
MNRHGFKSWYKTCCVHIHCLVGKADNVKILNDKVNFYKLNIAIISVANWAINTLAKCQFG